MKLKDKVAIVTGATKGIGVAIAQEFVKEGAKVVATGRTLDLGEKVVADIRAGGGQAIFVQGDVSKKADVDRMVAQALEHLGDRAAALSLLGAYLQEHPQDLEICRFAAEFAAHRAADRAVAITYYQRLYQDTRDPQVRRQLLDLLIALERFAEAIPLQEEEAGQFPEDQEALHRLALLHYWQRDYQAASQIYQRLLERAAQNAALRREAAQAADAGGQVDQALSHYLWLYGKHQGQREYAVALARLWAKKGCHAEAAAVLGPLMQDNPDVEMRRWYALELLLTRDFTKSLQAYEAFRASYCRREGIAREDISLAVDVDPVTLL